MKNELVKILHIIVLCVILCLVIAGTIAVLLRTTLFAEQKAYLYRLLAFDAIACILLIVLMIPIIKKHGSIFSLDLTTSMMCVALSTLFMALFLSLGPMTIERSYTIYSLAQMSDSGTEIYTADQIKSQFIEGFIEEANESQKRINEQVSIGNLEKVNNGYRITNKGKQLIQIMRLVEILFPVPDETCIYPNGH